MFGGIVQCPGGMLRVTCPLNACVFYGEEEEDGRFGSDD